MLFLYQKNTLKIYIFFFTFLVMGCAAIGSIAVPLESIDEPKGKYGIGTTVHFWTDYSRSEVYTTSPSDFRSLLVQVWYPAEIKPNYQKITHLVYPNKSVTSISKTAGIPSNFGKHGTQLMSNAVQGANPLSGKKFPLILFSHGNGGLATQNLSQVEELVSNGYIVVACNHTYNASITFNKDGDPFLFKRNVTWDEQASYHRKYYTNQLIKYRYQDIAFILDELTKEKSQKGMINPYRDLIDFNAIGIMGHSMGGGTSYYALLNNKRIKAALALDGWFFALSEEDVKINTKKPFMHIGQEEFFNTNVAGDMNKSEDGQENLKIYNLILENNKPSYAVYIKNSLHYTFTDLKQVYVSESPLAIPLSFLGKADKTVVKNTINESMISFFDSTLKNQEFQKNIYNKYNKEVIFINNENR